MQLRSHRRGRERAPLDPVHLLLRLRKAEQAVRQHAGACGALGVQAVERRAAAAILLLLCSQLRLQLHGLQGGGGNDGVSHHHARCGLHESHLTSSARGQLCQTPALQSCKQHNRPGTSGGAQEPSEARTTPGFAGTAACRLTA